MTFYWTMNINAWNGHKTNELVQSRKFYKMCHIVFIKHINSMLLKANELKALDCQLWQQVLFCILT